MVRKCQHIIEIPLEFLPCKPTPYVLLNLDDFKHLVLHLLADTVPLPVPSVYGLDHYRGRVPLEYSPQAVNVNLKIEEVLLCRLFFRVVRDVKLHELVQGTVAVSEGCILDPLLVRYNVVVQG